MTVKTLAYLGLLFLLIAVALLSGQPTGYQADWKLGRVYHRLVCTSCHIEQAGKAISPSDRTIKEWTAYYQAGRHHQSEQATKLNYYVSLDYRESIRHYNLAAEKFVDIPARELAADIQAFSVRGASNSDTPMRCQ